MLGILLNGIALLIIGLMMYVESTVVLILLGIVVFGLISFGFTISQSARAETDSCLYGLLMLANMIASGVLLLILASIFFVGPCGCAG